MDDGAGLRLLVETIAATTARAAAAGGVAAALAAALDVALGRLTAVTATLWAVGDHEVTLANASVYLEAAGHVVVGWLWLEQLLAVGQRTGDFYNGKRAAARFFLRYELPRTGAWFDLLARADRTTVEMRDAWF
jgi:butyryl-CoA dehydrogenase